MRGEAYGLRAFLHFDLLRLYCPDYRQQPEAQYGLPYSDAFNLENKTVYTLKGTYERILGDLDKAEEYLHNDTTMAAVEGRESEYDFNRPRQFNLYAVYATKARVYWSMATTPSSRLRSPRDQREAKLRPRRIYAVQRRAPLPRQGRNDFRPL